MKYEISKDRDEILKTISESNHKNRNILWQNNNDNRTVLEIHDIKIDPIKEVIFFNVIDPSSIDPELDVYIKLNHRNMIFKGSVLSNTNAGVYVQIPDKIKLEELRESKRYKFELCEKRKVLIEVDSSIESVKEHININLLDVSQAGIGIIVNALDSEKVKQSREVNLSNLGYFQFQSHFLMNPVYQSTYTTKDFETLYKIGFKFEENLPEKLLSDFIRSEEKLFENEMGFLGKSRKFQKKLHREYRQMLKKLENKSEFFEFFTGHGVINNLGEEYMSKHIRLLAMFSCAIAKLLDMDDKTIISNLTYCSFVHDLAYFTNPKLAQIKNCEHFEKVKHLLKVGERELFFRSKSYAYQFAKSDPHAPAGSELILKQLDAIHTHVHQDQMLARGGISPIVAVFLVAHNLVDYALTHPRWNFHDYLAQYQFYHFGDTFALIYEKLHQERIAA